MRSNVDIVRATYEGSAAENGERLREVLAPDCAWVEAAGFPYAGTYVGPDAVFAGVFHRLATEWIDYRAVVDSFSIVISTPSAPNNSMLLRRPIRSDSAPKIGCMHM